MKVKDLIEELQKLNPEDVILISEHEYFVDYFYGEQIIEKEEFWFETDYIPNIFHIKEKGKVRLGS